MVVTLTNYILYICFLRNDGSKEVREVQEIAGSIGVFNLCFHVPFQDLEEKVKRLQDSQQQSMLKIAGLRSAHKHAEAQAMQGCTNAKVRTALDQNKLFDPKAK